MKKLAIVFIGSAALLSFVAEAGVRVVCNFQTRQCFMYDDYGVAPRQSGNAGGTDQ